MPWKVHEQSPPKRLATANLSGKEYAWPTNAFLAALDESASAGFACIGGQFQFRFPDGTCEMYWLEADARDKEPSEIWSVYVERARQEVKAGFEILLQKQILPRGQKLALYRE